MNRQHRRAGARERAGRAAGGPVGPIAQWFNAALAHHHAGRIAEAELPPSGAGILPFWPFNESAAIEFSLPRNPQGRKIATNNFGIREMSRQINTRA